MFKFFGKNIGYGLLIAYLFGGPAIFKKFVGYLGDVAAARSSRDLRRLNSKIHTDMVEASRVDWKPISLFPEEAKRFKCCDGPTLCMPHNQHETCSKSADHELDTSHKRRGHDVSSYADHK